MGTAADVGRIDSPSTIATSAMRFPMSDSRESMSDAAATLET